MDQTQRYQLTTVALLIILTAFYLYTLNNNSQLEQTIQQLQSNNTQLQNQINTLQNSIDQQQNIITNQNITLETLFDNLGLSETQISELNETVNTKSELIIQYVNTLVDELYDFQYDKARYVEIINQLEKEIEELRALLTNTS